MEDIKLLRLLHQNPSAGMEQLMNQYLGLVYAVVKGKLSDSICPSSDVEDCVADVFSEFYLSLDRFDSSKSSIKSYLCVIARHNACDMLRKRQKGNLSLDNDEVIFQISDDTSAEESIIEEELRCEVIKAIEELGEPDSSIIFRKYYYGESSKSIAERLGMTVSNVDTRTHRALNKLKILFGG